MLTSCLSLLLLAQPAPEDPPPATPGEPASLDTPAEPPYAEADAQFRQTLADAMQLARNGSSSAAATAFRQALTHGRDVYTARKSEPGWLTNEGSDLVYYATDHCEFASALAPQVGRAMLTECQALAVEHLEDLVRAGVVEAVLHVQAESLALKIQHLLDQPRCGDGAISGGEACDDGNTRDGDRCTRTCELPPAPPPSPPRGAYAALGVGLLTGLGGGFGLSASALGAWRANHEDDDPAYDAARRGYYASAAILGVGAAITTVAVSVLIARRVRLTRNATPPRAALAGSPTRDGFTAALLLRF